MFDRCFRKHRDNDAADKGECDEAASLLFDFAVTSDVETRYDAAELTTVRVIPPARIILIHSWESPRPEHFQQVVKHGVLLDFPARLALGGVVVYLERCMDDRWQHLPPLPTMRRYQAKCLFGMALILTVLPGRVLTAWAEQQGANYLRPPIMIFSFVLGIVLFQFVVKRYVTYYYQPFYRQWLERLKKQLFDLRRSLRQQQFSANTYDLRWSVDSSAQDGSVLVNILTGEEVESAKTGSSIDKTKRKSIKVPDDMLRKNETIREKPAWERLSSVTMWHWGALSLTLRHTCPNFERHHSFRHWVLVIVAVVGWVVLFQQLFPDGEIEVPELLIPYFLSCIAVLLLAWQLALWYTERFVVPGKHAAFRTAVSDCSQPSLLRTSYLEKDPSRELVCGCLRMRIVPGVVQFGSDKNDEQSNHASAIAPTRAPVALSI